MFNAKHEQQRQQQMTPDRIMSIALRTGAFSVSLRYRDDWLRRRCGKLKKAGQLVGGRRIEHGQLVYYPSLEAREGLDAATST